MALQLKPHKTQYGGTNKNEAIVGRTTSTALDVFQFGVNCLLYNRRFFGGNFHFKLTDMKPEQIPHK